jgi:hypothetical protein
MLFQSAGRVKSSPLVTDSPLVPATRNWHAAAADVRSILPPPPRVCAGADDDVIYFQYDPSTPLRFSAPA